MGCLDRVTSLCLHCAVVGPSYHAEAASLPDSSFGFSSLAISNVIRLPGGINPVIRVVLQVRSLLAIDSERLISDGSEMMFDQEIALLSRSLDT